MKKALLIASVITAIFLCSCMDMGERINGSGNIKTENRQANKTNRIKVTGAIDVYIEQGPSAVKVEGDDNVLQYVETVNNDDWFEIKTKDDVNLNTSKPIKVYVTTPDLTDIKVTGSGNVVCNQKFTTNNNTSFEIMGSGDVTTAIHAPKVEAHITGSGNLHISGETKDVEIHVSGSGNFDGRDLKSENADVSVTGSGDADIFADSHIKASIAGSGNVKYKGSATIDSHVAGSGTISKDN